MPEVPTRLPPDPSGLSTACRTVLRSAATPQQSAPERACRVIGELLTLERQGHHHEVVDHRKRLRALNPELFAFYMQTRS